MYQMLSQSVRFCRLYIKKNFGVFFRFTVHIFIRWVDQLVGVKALWIEVVNSVYRSTYQVCQMQNVIKSGIEQANSI